MFFNFLILFGWLLGLLMRPPVLHTLLQPLFLAWWQRMTPPSSPQNLTVRHRRATRQKCVVAMMEQIMEVTKEKKLSILAGWEQNQPIFKCSRPRTEGCFPISRTHFMSSMDQSSVTSSASLTSSPFMVSKRGSSICGKDSDIHGKHSQQWVLQPIVTGYASGFRIIPNKAWQKCAHCLDTWAIHTLLY